MTRSTLIPTVEVFEPRANPLAWDDSEPAQGVFLDSAAQDDALALLGTPTLKLPEQPRLPEGFVPSQHLKDWLAQLQLALSQKAEGEPSPARFDVNGLDATSIQAVREILGEGEVDGRLTLDNVQYLIQESLLTGVWSIRDDRGGEWVEVAEVSDIARQAADSLAPADFKIPEPGGEIMNAPAVLAEIQERARQWSGDENHVINFTLLPMSEADHELLRQLLGRADLELKSGGFGDCRIMATRYRHVWAVQFVNAMGHTILDTIEVGSLPAAACAARQDFEDSATRLGEILEVYL